MENKPLLSGIIILLCVPNLIVSYYTITAVVDFGYELGNLLYAIALAGLAVLLAVFSYLFKDRRRKLVIAILCYLVLTIVLLTEVKYIYWDRI